MTGCDRLDQLLALSMLILCTHFSICLSAEGQFAIIIMIPTASEGTGSKMSQEFREIFTPFPLLNFQMRWLLFQRKKDDKKFISFLRVGLF
jgi:hypothetical protein